MSTIAEVQQPIAHRLIDKLKPALDKIIREMNVREVNYREDKVVFMYHDQEVKIWVRSKIKRK